VGFVDLPELESYSEKDFASRKFSLLSYLLPLLLIVLAVLIAWGWPDYYVSKVVSKDSLDGAGLAEDLTVLALLPAIFLTFYGLVRYRRFLPSPVVAAWFFVWALACIYFAGEEISWGQWYFQWETGETFRQINDQQETNLHNISSWLDQKPRTLVEIWVFAAGFLYPLVCWFRKRPIGQPGKIWFWLLPPREVVVTGFLFSMLYMMSWAKGSLVDWFASSELREMYIALFLCLTLSSFFLRLRRLGKLRG